LEIVTRTGSWYQFGAQKLGQGREGAKQFLRENAKIAKAIEEKVKEKMEKE